MRAPLRVGILEGSLRQASLSRAFGRAAISMAPESLSLFTLPSPGTLPIFDQDVLDQGMPDSVAAMVDAVAACDAILIVTPEYNWSVPGGLKNAIDWVSRVNPNPFSAKPATIWSVSPGLLGGARLHESMRQVMHSQNMIIMAKPEVQVAQAKSKIDVAESRITDEGTKTFLSAHLEAFAQFCDTVLPR